MPTLILVIKYSETALYYRAYHSRPFLALLLHERTQNRIQTLVAAGEQHHVGDVDSRSSGVSVWIS